MQKNSAPESTPKTILIATVGLTPAILTETVWALARENPPVIPDIVIVLTTKTGAGKIERQLFGGDAIWRQLRQSVLGRSARRDNRLDFDTTPDRLKIVHASGLGRRVALDGLVTRDQHNAFADAIMHELYSWTSRDDGTRVIASIAGGFKTMSVLMLTAMQLLANPGDRVTHVLAGGGYDSIADASPLFFFPGQNEQKLVSHDGRRLAAMDAARHIQLIDVPFIPLRRWFADALDRKPPDFETLVSSSAKTLGQRSGEDITLEFAPIGLPPGEDTHWVRLNGVRLKLTFRQYAYLRFFAGHRKEQNPPFLSIKDFDEPFKEWAEKNAPACNRLKEVSKHFDESNEDVSKRLNDLRRSLMKMPGADGRALAAALPGKGLWMLNVEPSRIVLR